MLARLAALSRTLRFRLWLLGLRLRLRRAGGRLVVEYAATPRFFTLPRLEILALGGPGGTLTLRLGRDVKLGRELVLDIHAGADNTLDVGDRSTFEAWCRVQLHGGAVALANDVHVRDLVQLKTKSTLVVGEWTVLSRAVIIHATSGVEIGAHNAMGERTSVIDSDHTADGSDVPVLRSPLKLAPIRLGRNVATSVGCVILRGTTVGDNAVLASGAVLNGGDFPAGWLVAGAPAAPKRALAAADG